MRLRRCSGSRRTTFETGSSTWASTRFLWRRRIANWSSTRPSASLKTVRDLPSTCSTPNFSTISGASGSRTPVGWNTHLVDGRWPPTFTNATYYFVDQEYRHWERHDSLDPMFDAGLATFVEPSAHLTPEVALIPSHGHTPGHVSVLIQSRGESAVISGDLMHTPCQIGRPDWSFSTPIRKRRLFRARPSWNVSRTLRRW